MALEEYIGKIELLIRELLHLQRVSVAIQHPPTKKGSLLRLLLRFSAKNGMTEEIHYNLVAH